jgi:hypothetical protein
VFRPDILDMSCVFVATRGFARSIPMGSDYRGPYSEVDSLRLDEPQNGDSLG